MLFAASLLLLAGVVPVALVNGSRNAGFVVEDRLLVLERCLRGTVNDSDRTTTDRRYQECAANALGADADMERVTRLLDGLYRARSSVDFLGGLCHDAAHAIGTVSYRTLGAGAFTPGYEQCGFGYYHGLMLAAATSGPVQGAVDQLSAYCDSYESNDPSNRDFCVHGIGHAIANRVQIPEGAALCSTLREDHVPGDEALTRDSSKISCFTGVLNEKLRYDYFARTGPTTVEEAVAPCRTLDRDMRSPCGRYTLHFSQLPVSDIRSACISLGAVELRTGCWEAVGFRGVDLLFGSDPTAPAQLSTLGGVNNDIFLGSPEKAATFLQRLCGGDPGSACVSRFALEVTQATQRPSYITGICDRLDQRDDREICEASVMVVSGTQGGDPAAEETVVSGQERATPPNPSWTAAGQED